MNTAGIHDIFFKGNHVHHIGRVCTDTVYGKTGFFSTKGASDIIYEGNVVHHIGRLHPEDGCNYTTDDGLRNNKNHDHDVYIHGTREKIVNNILHNNLSGGAVQFADGAAFSSNGYTHLDNYLNELADDFIPGNPYR